MFPPLEASRKSEKKRDLIWLRFHENELLLAEVPPALARYCGGWNLQSCETSQLTNPTPGWFTSSVAVAQFPPGTPSACRHPTSHKIGFALRYFSPSKGPLRCRRWTFESSPIAGHHVGYAECPHPFHAKVHNHMFSSSSPPTYIASIHINT